jgi:hypothetical protein
MATVNYTAGACSALLFTQNEVMKSNTPSELISPIGLVQALKDPSNVATAEFEQLGAGDGHNKVVRLVNRQPVVASAVTDAFACDAGAAVPRQEELVTINQHSHLALRVSESDVRALCEEYSNYTTLVGARMGTSSAAQTSLSVMREVYDSVSLGFDAIRQNMNSKLNTALATRLGEFVDGSTSKTYTIRNGAGERNGSPILDGFAKFKQDVRKTTLTGSPILVGSGLWELTNTALEYGCCNDGGTDFGQMARSAGYKFYIDDTTGTALAAADAAFAFMPGTAHLLTFNKNVGNFARPIGVRERGTIADPSVPGLRYDISIVPNECGEYYDVYLDIDFGLWTAPVTLFGTGDYRAGVNGIFKVIGASYTPA